ncbi:MAG: hypothetical protein LUC93_12325 [Planctomycetaceae bacterium]|nr:hypothetical protein [Planctomycetaceae bacterium]
MVSSVLVIVGAVLLYHSGMNFDLWRDAVLENAGIVALVMTTPLLAVCLRFYDFEADIRAFASHHVRSSLGFYALLLIVSFVVAMLLNMGAVPLLFFVFESLRKNYPERTVYNALTRGYFINIFWSPNFVSMAVVINYLGVQWSALVGWGLLLTFMGMAISMLLEYGRLRWRGELRPQRLDAAALSEEAGRDFRPGLYWIIGVVIYVMAMILLLEYALGKGISVVVPLVSLLAPLLLAACMRRWTSLRNQFHHYRTVTLRGYNNEVFLFLSAGFLASALRGIDMGGLVAEGLSALGVNSTLPLVVLLILFIGLPPLAGIHPIITISAVASVYASGGLAISQIQLALVMLTGYHIYAATSPFSSGVLLLSHLSHKSTIKLGIGTNGLYTLIVSACFAVIIASI